MKTAISIFVTALSLVAIALVYFPFGLAPNLGLPIGYYGEFNRMYGAIEKQGGLKVRDYGQHKDASLEGFWISAKTESGRVFMLDVGDGANVRTPKEKGKGIVVFTWGMKAVFVGSDSPFWKTFSGIRPETTKELLSQIDYFLEQFEAYPFTPSRFDYEQSSDSIRIVYDGGQRSVVAAPTR